MNDKAFLEFKRVYPGFDVTVLTGGPGMVANKVRRWEQPGAEDTPADVADEMQRSPVTGLLEALASRTAACACRAV